MSDDERRLFLAEWVDTLQTFTPEQVRNAWQEYYRSDHAFPDLKTIVSLIVKARYPVAERFAALNRELDQRAEAERDAKRQAEIDKMTPKRRAEIRAETQAIIKGLQQKAGGAA